MLAERPPTCTATTDVARVASRSLLPELLVNHGDVALRLIGVRGVALVGRGNRVLGGSRIRGLARFHRRSDPCQEIPVELAVLVEIGPPHHVAVARDDTIDAL